MFRPDCDQRLLLEQRLKTNITTLGFAPPDLLFDVMEERNDVPQAIVNVNVAISDRYEQDLELLRKCRQGQKQCNYIVTTLIEGSATDASDWKELVGRYRVSVNDDLTRGHCRVEYTICPE